VPDVGGDVCIGCKFNDTISAMAGYCAVGVNCENHELVQLGLILGFLPLQIRASAL